MTNVNSTNNRIFILTGFMASGKSYIGEKVAQLLNCEFIDLDVYIESRLSKSIKDIINYNGEDYFRKIETKSLKILLKNDKDTKIIAVGGGFPLRDENQLLLRKYTVIFIDIDFNTILSRLTPDEKAKRPLLANLKPDDIKKLYKKRLNIYRNTSNYIAHDINEVFKIIQSRLNTIKDDYL